MIKLRILSLLCLGLLLGGSAFGDNMHWNSVTSGVNWQGYGVSPYSATNLTKDPDVVLSLYCIDFNGHIAPPYDWVANLNFLDSGNLASFKYGGEPDAMTKYREAAWLTAQGQAAQLAHNTYNMQKFQVAAWTLFVYGSPGAPNDNYDLLYGKIGNGTFLTDVNNAVADAHTAVVTNGWTPTGYWYVVTPVPSAGIQEFLTWRPSPDLGNVPEPSSIALFGTVVAIVGLRLRRRKVSV
jgi:hypothetical protein